VLEETGIKRVDEFAEKLKDSLTTIGDRGDWGARFSVSKASVSDYWRSQVIVRGEPVKKNWLQLNGQTYSHPSYKSPKEWKIQARFDSPPDSPLWEKKPAYIRDRQPLEWSLGGLDVWAIAYESLSAALELQDEEDVEYEILSDLKSSWAYANSQKQEQVASDNEPRGRVQVTLSINSEIWAGFQEASSRDYRSRRKHSNRPSYAKLRDKAIDEALLNYVAARKAPEDNNDKQSEELGSKEGTMETEGLTVEISKSLSDWLQKATVKFKSPGKSYAIIQNSIVESALKKYLDEIDPEDK
jgi:hypothetical protein